MTDQEAIKLLEDASRNNQMVGILPKSDIGKCLINALEEIQQYRAIGTPQECMDAVNKQMAHKPQKVLLSHGTGYECKQCGNELSVNAFNGEYCHWCGQKLDWSDEE